jgi:hypothetical protein
MADAVVKAFKLMHHYVAHYDRLKRTLNVSKAAQSRVFIEAAGPDSGIAHGARGSTFKFCRNSYTSQNPEVIKLRKRLDKLTPMLLTYGERLQACEA